MNPKPHPDRWPLYIYVTSYLTTGKNHGGDLVDIGSWFAVAVYAMKPHDESSGFGRYGSAWIPRLQKWDHVLTTPPGSERLDYDTNLWKDLMTLANMANRFQQCVNVLVTEGNIHRALHRVQQANFGMLEDMGDRLLQVMKDRYE